MSTASIHPHKLAGRATGAAMMWGFALMWLFLALIKGRPLPAVVWFALAVAGLAVAASVLVLRRRASRLSRNAPPATREEAAIAKQMGRRFGMIFGLEGAGIFVGILLCNIFQHPNAIICVIGLVVSIHFFPLARLFHASIYHVTACVGCLLGLSGLLIADVALRHTVVAIGFALLLWATSLVIVLRALPLTRTSE